MTEEKTLSFPRAQFGRLTTLSEILLGDALRRVLFHVGVVGRRDRGMAAVLLDNQTDMRGGELLDAAERFLYDVRNQEVRLSDVTKAMTETPNDIDYALRHLKNGGQCHCKDYDDGEHSAKPQCGPCVLRQSESRLRRTLGLIA